MSGDSEREWYGAWHGLEMGPGHSKVIVFERELFNVLQDF